jgi:hypothetical protein
LVLCTVAAVAIFRHPMWFDELQAWNIARASGSPFAVLSNLRYEGHPAVWYLLLYGLTRWTTDPRAMQVLELVVLAATVAVLLFRSPFPFWLRVGLAASYVVAFEYGVISRSYGVEVLLLVVLLALVVRAAPRWTAATVVAGLLAFTSLAGALLVVAFAVNTVLRRADRVRARVRFAVVAVLAAGASAFTCVPPSDFHNFAPGLGGVSRLGDGALATPMSAFAGVWRGLVPIPRSPGAWNTNLFDTARGSLPLQAALGLALVAVVWWALAAAPAARSLWLLGCVAFFAYSVVVILPEQSRYAGVAMLLLVACAWVGWAEATGIDADAEARPDALHHRLPRVLAAIVGLQVVATVLVAPFATSAQFSPARELAASVRAAGLDGPVVSGADFDALTIAGYLGRDVYSAARGEWTPYFVHDDRQARGTRLLTDEGIECAAAAVATEEARPVALVVRGRHLGGFGRVVARRDGVTVLAVRPGTRVPGCRS